MLAPPVGAVCTRLFAGAHLQFGRPEGRWLLVALTAVFAVLVIDLLSPAVEWTALHVTVLGQALTLAPVTVALACISALGEEIGWRRLPVADPARPRRGLVGWWPRWAAYSPGGTSPSHRAPERRPFGVRLTAHRARA